MIIALTGTPGIGKTTIANILKKKGYEVVGITKISLEKNYFIGFDKSRNSKIVDIEKLNKYIDKNYKNDNIVIIEGHLSHLIKCVNKVIILRCKPDELEKRLLKKGWKKEKIKENIEAEILDVILCEAVEFFSKKDIFEINTTKKSVICIANIINEIIEKGFKNMKKYNIGNIDWSEEILKDF